ncbi:DUF6882 domain-containing protein [Cellulosimicrobium protaetiae]|uniref:Uncharacterized protein n=1 Tax=Cellulosimicrobium protaetiae TaxID=2587808 RepID=A0A6M5UBY2_9MICO|nr:DUF6882 domain-containing protein [Cellulosimicrobium protaetiae]QJW36007.1 hypothetical protein FIC82_007140 [Cellulosimicrobium protaetiae]
MTEPQTAHGTAEQTAPALQELVDDAAFLSHEHQLHLADLHGDDAWGAEMSTGTFTFTAPGGETATCRLQFLGTAAPGPGSWMWAWHNVNGFPDDVLRAAGRTRESGLREAGEPELPLTDDLPYRLALATKAVTGSWTHYSAPVGGGTRAWFLLEDESLVLPAPSVPRVVRVLSEGLLSVTVVDHRRAVASYSSARGLEATDDGGTAELTLPDGHVTVRFDEHDRIAGIQATARRAPEPDPTQPGAGEPAEGTVVVVEPGLEASGPEAPEPDDSGPDDSGDAPSGPHGPAATAPAATAPAATAPADEPAPEPRRRSWFRRRG